MLERQPPYRISQTIDRFARRIWFSPRAWFPAIMLKATAEIAPLKEACRARGVSINAALIKALAKALSEFPRLNYYTVLGRMVWGGPKTRISIVVEDEKFESCRHILVEDAENKTLEEIQGVIESGRAATARRASAIERLMNAFPRTMFFLIKLAGKVGDEVIANNGVVVLTNINNPQIDEMMTTGIYFTMILSPGTSEDGRIPLTLSFNHELANARPADAYLARVKEIIESDSL